MGFFDSLSENVANYSRAIGSKTKEVTEATRISFQITQEKAKLKAAYEELGKAYYEAYKDQIPEELQFLADGVKESLDRLAQMSDEKQSYSGKKTCCGCGAVMEKDALFCSKCGTRNEIPAEPVIDDDDIFEDTDIEFPEEEAETEAPATEKTCPHCGTAVKAEILYCPNCGEKL